MTKRTPLLKYRLFVVFVLLVGMSTNPAVAQNRAANTSSKGIEHARVVWMKNPAHEAVVSWSTREAGKQHRVHYDTRPRKGKTAAYAHTVNTFRDGQFTTVSEDAGVTVPTFYHHAHLEGLEPSTTYYLVIESDGNVSREYHFITAPDDDRPITVLHGGDSRLGGSREGDDPFDHDERQAMNLRIAALVEQHPEIVALAHGGDYCVRAELRYIDRWLTDFELVTTKDGRLLPIIPTRGNHDMSVGFEEMFAWPEKQNEHYFTTQLSGEVTLVTLNTETSMGGYQRDWLKEQLAQLRPDNQWVFVQYHRPAYTSVKNPQRSGNQRQFWVPLFEQYNVDLVCESDDHALKRTLPIRDGKPDLENGITYIGDGGLGVPQRKPDPTRWWLQEPGFATAAHHVFMLEFTPDKLHVRAIGMDGDVLKEFELMPRAVLADE